MTADKTYDLLQVFKNERDGSTFTTHFDTYASLKEAKTAAKDMRGKWVIVENKIVARSDP